jgi:hypothetical protein
VFAGNHDDTVVVGDDIARLNIHPRTDDRHVDRA